MCGVLGFFGEFKKNKKTIIKLVDEISIRGIHSFGFSFIERGELKTIKEFEINEIKKSLIFYSPNKFIFHNRYSTSGDWKKHENNQPIAINKNSIVLNGVISQSTKAENEKKYLMDLSTENDAEILLRSADKNTFIKNHKGSLAGMICIRGNYFAFRNERRPLWYSRKAQDLFVASTKDCFLRAGIKQFSQVPTGSMIPIGELA